MGGALTNRKGQPRNQLVAAVHVAKKQLALDDETYRAIIERVTGERSSAHLTVAQLGSVLDEFRRLGWKPAHANYSHKPHVRKVWALWSDLVRRGLVKGGRVALRKFVFRMTKVNDPQWLTLEQAAKVTEGLKAWGMRLQSERDAAEATAPESTQQ
jgi:hypothetical protein